MCHIVMITGEKEKKYEEATAQCIIIALPACQGLLVCEVGGPCVKLDDDV